MQKIIYPGLRVRTIAGEQDTDGHGADRHTPPGTWGHISEHNHADHWDVVFPNGAWVVLTEAELCDATQYELDRSKTSAGTTFDPSGAFTTPDDALQQIWRQPDPIKALLALVEAQVGVDECGFASEVVRDFISYGSGIARN